MKIETWLPVFPGFYGTYYEPDETNEIEHINQERENNKLTQLPYDAIEFDYEEYENNISESACSVIESELSEYITKIVFQRLSSPKEYNFTNDSIHCEIWLSPDNEKTILSFLENNKDKFAEYLRETYTSYDGFISHYSNDINDWLTDKDLLTGSHELGSILQFICDMNNVTNESIFEFVLMDSYLSAKNYSQCIEEEYCNECNSFVGYPHPVANTKGGVCNDCLELGKKTGEYIFCSHCNTEITNKWQKRQLEYKIKHSIIRYDNVLCNDCELMSNLILT